MISPYDILSNLVKVKDETVAPNKKNAISNRIAFISNVLNLKNILNYVDAFDAFGVPMANIVCIPEFKNDKPTLIVIAHHDTNNVQSENVNDNSASVSHLISLLEWVKDNPGDINIIGVFTDCEEFGAKGAEYLSKQIRNGDYGKVIGVLNMELTAHGELIWKDDVGSFLPMLKDKAQVHTPPCDTTMTRRYGIPSVCIGTLPRTELEPMLLTEHYYCKTWAVCHQMYDTLATASESDMNDFQNSLREIVSNITFAESVY